MRSHVSGDEEERYAELQRMALDFARVGEAGELEKMIRAGLPVNLADQKGNSLLMLAAYNGELETVQMLIRMGADPDRKNDRGQTPLGGVAFKGFADIARELIESGADLHADNGAGMRHDDFAAMFGNFEVKQMLEAASENSGDAHNKRRWWHILPVFARIIGRIRFYLKRE